MYVTMVLLVIDGGEYLCKSFQGQGKFFMPKWDSRECLCIPKTAFAEHAQVSSKDVTTEAAVEYYGIG